MAERTESAIEIAAPAGEILDVIADFPAYPQWAEQVKAATILAEDGDGWADEVEFVLDAGVIKDTYVLSYDWDIDEAGAGVVSWHLVRSEMLKAMDGSYTLKEGSGGTTVTYRLSVDVVLPMLGMIKRRAEKLIIETALKELKKRVEH
ncbi:MAG: SRPBCC family protein [Nostocoides sp.]